MKISIVKTSLLALGFAVSTVAQAAWPKKPIRVIVPFSAGVGGDVMMRLITEDLGHRLGQPVVVENREGAAGNIGTTVAANSAPDGYTFLVSQTSNFVINQHLFRSFKVDPLTAFEPVVHMGNTPAVLLTNADIPPNDLQAFTDYAKAHKGKLNYGSPGVGTPPHLTLMALNQTRDLGMISVTYRGSSPVLLALVSGELTAGFALYGQALQFIKAGKIRPLAVQGTKRLRMLPDTPSFAEFGMTGVGTEPWWAMVAPKGTPTAIMEKMNEAVRAALSSPKVRQQLEDAGIDPVASTREEAVEKFRSEANTWAKIIRNLNV